jgi:lipocalin
MGKWYVISARGIFVENEAYNSTETYTWNEEEKRIDVDFRISDIHPDYQWVVVGIPSQRYLWVMARKPEIPDSKLEKILARIDSMGYSTRDMRKVPQRWQSKAK